MPGFPKSVRLILWSLPGGEGSQRELPDTDRYSEGEGSFFSFITFDSEYAYPTNTQAEANLTGTLNI